jgi:asparagine synthase (glutamine-hydrolysing)
MSRLTVVLDWSGALDPNAVLDRIERAMTAGGTRERAHRWLRPPLAALALSHDAEPPSLEDEEALVLAAGIGPPLASEIEFLRACRGWDPARGESGLPSPPDGPRGRRAFVIWDPRAEVLTLVAEPNGQLPIFIHRESGLTILSTEPKGVWSASPRALEVDADALIELCAVGQCLGTRSLFRGVRSAEPGAVLRLSRDPERAAAFPPPRWNDGREGRLDSLASEFNRAVLESLAAVAPGVAEASVALSGGMDSRYVLAAALRSFARVHTITFGEPPSTDLAIAARVARRAGVEARRYPPDPRFLERWANLAVWRADGMLGPVHAHGMDAVIADAAGTRHVLNGYGGDCQMGTFLHPWHLRSGHDPERGARSIIATRRFHAHEPGAMLKPEIARAATTSPEETLRGLLARYPFERMGNTMIAYWLRHYLPRLPQVGLVLEEPWARYLTPLADAHVVRAAAPIPLELRATSRVHRRALTLWAPALASVPWERSGVPPAWPWPAHVAGRLARRAGLFRPHAAVDHARHLRTAVATWVRDTLVSDRALENGFLEPGYVRDLVDDHLSGRASRTGEINLALSIELWRRMFLEREGPPDALPPLPQPA